jgi:hypothetical protein
MKNKEIKVGAKPVIAILLLSLIFSSCSVTYRERHRRPPPPPREKVIIVH